MKERYKEEAVTPVWLILAYTVTAPWTRANGPHRHLASTLSFSPPYTHTKLFFVCPHLHTPSPCCTQTYTMWSPEANLFHLHTHTHRLLQYRLTKRFTAHVLYNYSGRPGPILRISIRADRGNGLVSAKTKLIKTRSFLYELYCVLSSQPASVEAHISLMTAYSAAFYCV